MQQQWFLFYRTKSKGDACTRQREKESPSEPETEIVTEWEREKVWVKELDGVKERERESSWTNTEIKRGREQGGLKSLTFLYHTYLFSSKISPLSSLPLVSVIATRTPHSLQHLTHTSTIGETLCMFSHTCIYKFLNNLAHVRCFKKHKLTTPPQKTKTNKKQQQK